MGAEPHRGELLRQLDNQEGSGASHGGEAVRPEQEFAPRSGG